MSDTQLSLICPPLRTNCYFDENPISYLTRLADKNTYSSYRWLLEGKGGKTVDFEKLYQACFDTEWTGFESTAYHLSQICALPKTHLNSKWLRYCPICLQEENYWRISWQLKISVACIQHRIWLKDLCPHCQKPYRFHGPRKNSSKCLEYLARAETKPAPIAVIRLQQFLETGMLTGDHPFFDTSQWLPLARRYELLVFLMSWLAIGEDSAKPGRQTFEHMADFSVRTKQCADALFSDQNGFWRYLQTIHLARASFIGIQQKRLVYFYRQFFNEFPEPLFQRLKEIVEQYATENLIRDITKKNTLFSPDAKKMQRWYSFSRACREYNLAPSELNRAIIDKQVAVHLEQTNTEYSMCSVYRPDLEKILPHLKGLVTAYEAANILGVTKAQFLQLQNNGCFKFEVAPRRGYCTTWQYSKLELETLMETINKSAATPTEDCVLLAPTMKNRIQGRIDLPFLQVFRGIVSGQIIVRKPDAKSRTFREFWLDKVEFCKWIKGLQPQSNAMTITDVAELFRISEEFAYQLVNRGYLIHSVGPRGTKLVFPDHIRRFRREFVILSKLSETSEIASSRIMSILEDAEIYPVDHGDRKKLRQILYAREDLLKSSFLFRYVQHLPETRL
ncbi:TniQ family protein [Methylomonas fluvii]|uniref:TniQ family protein n=1 Tax=Methylomonas fluvii TaxID=1854564 RepID=A0ABR9D8U6_9GAMM|nr:TniQ family protein [Methylomonas fluvii]MBD9359518.1 TniQ family protein [Methylomonas fluvii]